jgi:iron complex transport system substrate-binding protein
VALPDVASFSSVDVEQVVSLDPDLVVAGGLGFTPPDVITRLRSLDIPVVVVYAPSVEGVYDDIELLGTATGTSDAAVAVTTAMRAEIDAISGAVATAGTPPRVYYEIGYDATTGAIYAPAEASFVAEMVTLAGGDTITTGDPNTYEIALEKLIERDPEVIVLGVNPFYEPTPEAVAARPGWNVMTAVANDDIRTVRDTEITRPGPRLPIGLRALASTIRPDVTLPAAP